MGVVADAYAVASRGVPVIWIGPNARLRTQPRKPKNFTAAMPILDFNS
jgi:hypothetical protein